MNNEENKQNTTAPVTESVPKENVSKVAEKKQEESYTNIIESASGINLVPILTKEEIVKEEKKQKLNYTSIVSIILFLSISMIVVGFNIISKLQLNAEKDKLYVLEDAVQGYSTKIVDNNEILDRIVLYEDIQGNQYSTKAVVEYINQISGKSGQTKLTSFTFTGVSGISFEGESEDLEDIAKFWYLLNNDDNIQNVTMDSISKGINTVTFSFDGTILTEKFLKSKNSI